MLILYRSRCWFVAVYDQTRADFSSETTGIRAKAGSQHVELILIRWQSVDDFEENPNSKSWKYCLFWTSCIFKIFKFSKYEKGGKSVSKCILVFRLHLSHHSPFIPLTSVDISDFTYFQCYRHMIQIWSKFQIRSRSLKVGLTRSDPALAVGNVPRLFIEFQEPLEVILPLESVIMRPVRPTFRGILG